MYIERLSVSGFRNLDSVEIIPDRHINIITGNNAQGKTNLIEAIYSMTGCKSFRNSKETDYINLVGSSANVSMQFNDSTRSQTIEYNILRSKNREKPYTLNGVKINPSELFEKFKCVVFIPDDIELIKGTPDRRRRFIDMCYCQLKPSALDRLKRLELITAHRNALLKKISLGLADVSTLNAWNVQLAEFGTYISYMRYKYTNMLSSKATELYSKVSGNTETMTISYVSNVFDATDFKDGLNTKLVEKYLSCLQSRTSDDIKAGYTVCGASRDDVVFKINGLSTKTFGSQGQKKSTAIVMKLAQADIYLQKTNETPIILLDDVMGELDADRQKYICSILGDTQVFITVCNEDSFINTNSSKVFVVQDGTVTEKDVSV